MPALVSQGVSQKAHVCVLLYEVHKKILQPRRRPSPSIALSSKKATTSTIAPRCTVTLAITPLGRRGAEDGGLGPLRVSGGKVWCTALKPYGRVFVLTQRLLPVCCARETAS